VNRCSIADSGARRTGFRAEGEKRFRREGERFSPEPGMAFALPGISIRLRRNPHSILEPSVHTTSMPQGGEVYCARDTKRKSEFAMKVLPEAFAHDPDRMACFQREAGSAGITTSASGRPHATYTCHYLAPALRDLVMAWSNDSSREMFLTISAIARCITVSTRSILLGTTRP
jgi:hypothetical protein